MGLFGSLFGSKKSKRKAKARKAAKGTSRKGTTKTGKQAPKKNLPDIDMPRGSTEIPVEGLAWAKLNLTETEDRMFALTPKNTYQIEQGWPEGEILNVCRKGAKRTTEKNWVGYISGRYVARLQRIVMSHGATNVHARIEKKNGKTTMTILV